MPKPIPKSIVISVRGKEYRPIDSMTQLSAFHTALLECHRGEAVRIGMKFIAAEIPSWFDQKQLADKVGYILQQKFYQRARKPMTVRLKLRMLKVISNHWKHVRTEEEHEAMYATRARGKPQRGKVGLAQIIIPMLNSSNGMTTYEEAYEVCTIACTSPELTKRNFASIRCRWKNCKAPGTDPKAVQEYELALRAAGRKRFRVGVTGLYSKKDAVYAKVAREKYVEKRKDALLRSELL